MSFKARLNENPNPGDATLIVEGPQLQRSREPLHLAQRVWKLEQMQRIDNSGRRSPRVKDAPTGTECLLCLGIDCSAGLASRIHVTPEPSGRGESRRHSDIE